MNLFGGRDASVSPQHLDALKNAVRSRFGLEAETRVMLTELQCTEPGCPPVETVIAILAAGANKLHGTFERNPFYSPKFGGAEMTVHPIGGANMSSDGTGKKGVTDHLGQVFQGTGSEVYDGLVVVDGAVVPAALGVNPFATITALAERSVEKLATQKGWNIDYDTKNGILLSTTRN